STRLTRSSSRRPRATTAPWTSCCGRPAPDARALARARSAGLAPAPVPGTTGIMAGMAADPVRKPDNTAITVSPPAVQRIGSWVCAPVLGAVIGWLLRLASTWVASLSWAPFQGVFKLLASGSDPWGTIAVVAGGAAIGLGFAGMWAQERVVVGLATAAGTPLSGPRRVGAERDGTGAALRVE